MPVFGRDANCWYECCHSLFILGDLPTRLILFRALLGSDFQWWKPAVFAGELCFWARFALSSRGFYMQKTKALGSLIINGSFKVQMDGVRFRIYLPPRNYPFSSSISGLALLAQVNIIPALCSLFRTPTPFDCELLTSSQTNITWKASTDSLSLLHVTSVRPNWYGTLNFWLSVILGCISSYPAPNPNAYWYVFNLSLGTCQLQFHQWSYPVFSAKSVYKWI